ncbi:MAG: hypothetical protein ACREVE_16870 [Gammaproteobacteria bacterium]
MKQDKLRLVSGCPQSGDRFVPVFYSLIAAQHRPSPANEEIEQEPSPLAQTRPAVESA